MDANLKTMAQNIAYQIINPFPSDGSTVPLQVKTTITSNNKRLASNSSHLISFSWSCAALGFLLSMITLESPSMSVSTDPTLEMVGNLWDYQATLPMFGTPSLLRCTDLIINLGGNSLTGLWKVHLINQADDSDNIIIEGT